MHVPERQASGLMSLEMLLGFAALVAALVFGARTFKRRRNASRRERDAAELAAREAAQRQAAAAEERLRAQEESALQAVVVSCSTAERTFGELPDLLTNATAFVDDARGHKEAGAFSPFWSSIESASVYLGSYNASVHALMQLAAEYPGLVASYRSLSAAGRVPVFPVSLKAAEATSAGEVVADALRSLAYEAQKDPVYAQIWEQRRTTSAVVEGFASLEVAIDRLARTVESSSRALMSQVDALGDAVEAGGRSVAGAVASASVGQAERDRVVAARMDQAVWLLEDQRQRAIGWS